jgi:hypothetical protein
MSRVDTHDLTDYRPIEGAHILSVYLQNHSIETLTVLENRLKTIQRGFEEQVEQREFEECVSRILKFLSKFEPRGETLAIFCSSTGPLWVRQINVILPNEVRWDEEPYWRPLIEAIDEFEPYGVVALEKFKARILSVYLGTIHEHRLLERATDDLDAFLAKVIAATQELLMTECPNRLIVAGDRDVRQEFLLQAPRLVNEAVIGSIGIPADASMDHILNVTRDIDKAAERRFEARRVAELIRLAARHKRVALGLKSTLAALNGGSVWCLVYSENLTAGGSQCPLCNGLFTDDVVICSRCNVATRCINDVLAHAVTRALELDASIEEVRGAAADSLDAAGGIGAFLRF